VPTGSKATPEVIVIGAGPAGLTAAFELVKRAVPVTVLEGDAMVGGISRTAEREGWRFDIGGHRFFTKVPEVEALWHEILPAEDFLMRPRMSRIFYNGKLYDYPLKAGNALRNLGPVEAVLCVLSYAWVRVRPPKDQSTLEGWIVARFGQRLYQHFFKTYNEKLWGVPVNKLPADFAAQRIKNLSLSSAIKNALLPNRNQKDITSLIEEFPVPEVRARDDVGRRRPQGDRGRRHTQARGEGPHRPLVARRRRHRSHHRGHRWLRTGGAGLRSPRRAAASSLLGLPVVADLLVPVLERGEGGAVRALTLAVGLGGAVVGLGPGRLRVLVGAGHRGRELVPLLSAQRHGVVLPALSSPSRDRRRR